MERMQVSPENGKRMVKHRRAVAARPSGGARFLEPLESRVLLSAPDTLLPQAAGANAGLPAATVAAASQQPEATVSPQDATKYADDGGASLFTTMSLLGLTSNRVSVFWDWQHPGTIQDQAFLDRLASVATLPGSKE